MKTRTVEGISPAHAFCVIAVSVAIMAVTLFLAPL